jgi:hypothetical protein
MLHSVSVIFLLLVAGSVEGQGRADAYVREGDRHFQQMAYARAVASYTMAAELGAVNEHVTKRLAETHMLLGNTSEAERWYAVVVKFLNREPRDLYNYAEALKSNGRYEEAEEWMDRYLATGSDGTSTARSNISGFARKYMKDQERFTVKTLGVNSPYSDFGATWLGKDQVVFASARNVRTGVERMAAINDQPFLDLFVADVNTEGGLGEVRELEGAVNTKLHEGPASASSSGDELWFTRNSFFHGRSQRSHQGLTRLGIYKATREDGEFGNVEEFLFNNSEVSIGHPSLSADGQRLFFVSDMPGGNGGSDIYFCRKVDGRWGEPENLGPTINTSQNEVFPFIAADGTLYFSSNGHPGLGGLDILAAKPKGASGFGNPMNVGAPVNGPKDDFSFVIDPVGKRGFFSSNRPGGEGDDDMYAFVMHRPLDEQFLVTGTVIDDEYEIPVIAAEVMLYDDSGVLRDTAFSDHRGEFAFPVEPNKVYRLVAKLKGRYDGERFFSTERVEQQQIMTRDIHLVADAGIWLRGAVRQKDKLGFLEGMTVSVVNLSSFYSESQVTDEGGGFRFRLQNNEEYEVLFEKPGYFSQSVPVSTIGMKQGILDLGEVRDLEFEPIQLGVAVPFRHIRWSSGSSALDRTAHLELDALAERLMVNPDVTIEIGVHSDQRAEATEAGRLSQKQADAIAAYLITKGVGKERVKARGYGTTQPLNHCMKGVACSEEEHAVNRRNEYKVTGLTP